MSRRPRVGSIGASDKRPRGSPTGDTPGNKRRSSQSRDVRPQEARSSQRQLFSTLWTEQEDCALVEFILLTRSDQFWPADKSSTFWDSAARYVFSRSKSTQKRSGIM